MEPFNIGDYVQGGIRQKACQENYLTVLGQHALWLNCCVPSRSEFRKGSIMLVWLRPIFKSIATGQKCETFYLVTPGNSLVIYKINALCQLFQHLKEQQEDIAPYAQTSACNTSLHHLQIHEHMQNSAWLWYTKDSLIIRWSTDEALHAGTQNRP